MNVETILRHYESAPEPVRTAGRLWYPQAQEACRHIGMDIVPVETVARVMAILSPRCLWKTCVGWTRVMVGAAVSGQPLPAVSTAGNRRKAWAELHGELAVSGPKTTAFARAILGDEQAVVIDAWILRVFDLQPEQKVTGKRQREITAAFTEAAAVVGETPRDLQAIVWCVVRGKAN